MARIKPKRGTRFPTSWSISRYNTWRKCAYLYLLKYILKLPETKGPAMERGIRIHSLLEQLLLGKVTGMPDDLKKMAKEVRNIKKLGATPEAEWTLTKEAEQTHWRDWKGAYVRAKVDIHHFFEDTGELLIVDLKTGRFNIAQAQMDLYAAMSRFFYPEAETIHVELWFSDQGEVHPQEYTYKEADDLWPRWVKRADDMLSDRKFLPSPGSACRYCPFKSSKKMPNGEMGPCEDWKKAS